MDNQYYQSPNNQYGQSGYNHNIKPKKNGARALLAILIIILLLCCGGIGLVVRLIVNITKPKDPIDLHKFEIAAQELGYSSYSGNDDTYVSVYKDDYSTEITIEKWDSETLAKSEVETYKYIYDFEDASSISSMTGTNYEKYTWKYLSTYYFVYRVDDTVLWMYSEDKDNIKELQDKLEY